MNTRNVLAVLGSPHANGMTAAMLNCAICKAEEIGYSVSKINLYEKNLSFCTGCRACMDKQICVQKDERRKMRKDLDKQWQSVNKYL